MDVSSLHIGARRYQGSK